MAIDLNADVGESYGMWRLGADEEIIPLISSANVACGFHGGDPGTLRTTTRACHVHGVAIGAQVSYPDLLGFGRRFIDMASDDLRDAVLYQIGALHAFASVAGTRIRYIKPHGALNNTAMHHEVHAAAIAAAVADYDDGLAILAMPGSRLARATEAAGLRVVHEAYADRAYRPDGALVSRREPGAVLEDPAVIADRVERLATGATISAIDGSMIAIDAESICLHSDTAGAAEAAKAIRTRLHALGVEVRSFAR